MDWNSLREYESGLDRGVFYPSTGPGEAWSGLISIDENSSDTNEVVKYIDGIRINQRRMLGYFAGNIIAYYYPDSLYEDEFTQRRVKSFGLSYRTRTSESYKIHLVYNVLISPAEYVHQQTEVEPFRWLFSTLPVEIPGATQSAHLVIDASIAYSNTMNDLEDMLYGTDETEPHLPSPIEVLSIFENNAILKVTDHGDGTFTIDGPDSAIIMLDATTFEVTWPSVVILNSNTYQISSL